MPEPVIPQIPKEDLDHDLRQVFDTGIERTGDATIIGVMAQQPDILRWYFSQFYDGLFYNDNPGMTVDVRTKELLRLKLSKQHGCQFCNRFNTVDAMAAGITQDTVDHLMDSASEHHSPKDQVVLQMCEEMMLQNQQGHLSQELYSRLRQHYDDGQIVEMGFIAAILTGVAKWIFTFDMVNREETCPF